jgi:hypothetical protein
VVALAAIATAYALVRNPINIDLGRFFPLYLSATVLVAAMALVHAVSLLFENRAVRLAVVAVGSLLTSVGMSLLAAALILTSDSDEEETVLASHGDVRLVRVDGRNVIDPLQSVHIQRRFGPVRQASVVWQGIPESNDTVVTAGFTGPREVTVTVRRWNGHVCEYRTGFASLTLEPGRRFYDHDRIDVC